MEYGLAKKVLNEYIGDAFKRGLPAVYVVSNRQEQDYLKVGLVRYGDLQSRMGSFLTWSRGFLIHYVLFTDTILHVNSLEKEIHEIMTDHKFKRIPFEPNIYFKKLSEWFKITPKEIEVLFKKIKTPLVKIIKLNPNPPKKYLTRSVKKELEPLVKVIPIKKSQQIKAFDDGMKTVKGRDKRKFATKKTFPIYIGGVGIIETSFK